MKRKKKKSTVLASASLAGPKTHPNGSKRDLSIMSDAAILKEMRAARREMKGAPRESILDHYETAMGNWNYAINERNKLVKVVWKLEAKLERLCARLDAARSLDAARRLTSSTSAQPRIRRP